MLLAPVVCDSCFACRCFSAAAAVQAIACLLRCRARCHGLAAHDWLCLRSECFRMDTLQTSSGRSSNCILRCLALRWQSTAMDSIIHSGRCERRAGAGVDVMTCDPSVISANSPAPRSCTALGGSQRAARSDAATAVAVSSSSSNTLLYTSVRGP